MEERIGAIEKSKRETISKITNDKMKLLSELKTQYEYESGHIKDEYVDDLTTRKGIFEAEIANLSINMDLSTIFMFDRFFSANQTAIASSSRQLRKRGNPGGENTPNSNFDSPAACGFYFSTSADNAAHLSLFARTEKQPKESHDYKKNSYSSKNFVKPITQAEFGNDLGGYLRKVPRQN